MIKGIIYDMDDLMVNTHPLSALAWAVLFSRYGREFSELPESLSSSFVGMRVVDVLEEIRRFFSLEMDVDSLYLERTEIFLELVREQMQALPGMRSSLEMFRDLGYPIALASSGAKQYIDIVLDKFSVGGYFQAVVSGDDVRKGKPDPETYLVAARKLGLPPHDCLVLEDATKGIQAAKSAGCRCIGVRNPNTPPQDRSQADLIIDSLEILSVSHIEDFR